MLGISRRFTLRPPPGIPVEWDTVACLRGATVPGARPRYARTQPVLGTGQR